LRAHACDKEREQKKRGGEASDRDEYRDDTFQTIHLFPFGS
jgi:hypothetical protein